MTKSLLDLRELYKSTIKNTMSENPGIEDMWILQAFDTGNSKQVFNRKDFTYGEMRADKFLSCLYLIKSLQSHSWLRSGSSFLQRGSYDPGIVF